MMDSVGLVAGLMGAQMAKMQYAVAAKIIRSSPDGAQNALAIIAAAETNADKLAVAAQGLGQNIDIQA
jgi:coenzyme F420-reducing hydrogenase delta subunit